MKCPHKCFKWQINWSKSFPQVSWSSLFGPPLGGGPNTLVDLYRGSKSRHKRSVSMHSHWGMLVFVGLFHGCCILQDLICRELEGLVLLVAGPPLGALISYWWFLFNFGQGQRTRILPANLDVKRWLFWNFSCETQVSAVPAILPSVVTNELVWTYTNLFFNHCLGPFMTILGWMDANGVAGFKWPKFFSALVVIKGFFVFWAWRSCEAVSNSGCVSSLPAVGRTVFIHRPKRRWAGNVPRPSVGVFRNSRSPKEGSLPASKALSMIRCAVFTYFSFLSFYCG